MKKILSIILFVVIAAALIGVGVKYDNKLSEQSRQGELALGVAAQQEQARIMQNFKIEDVNVGTGAVAESGDTVTVNYVGTLDNGTKFDASADHGQPFSFPLGAGKVIKGWDRGVLGMRVGGTRKLTIPPELAYGDRAIGPIPPNSTLHFTIDLLAVSTSSVSAPGGK